MKLPLPSPKRKNGSGARSFQRLKVPAALVQPVVGESWPDADQRVAGLGPHLNQDRLARQPKSGGIYRSAPGLAQRAERPARNVPWPQPQRVGAPRELLLPRPARLIANRL